MGPLILPYNIDDHPLPCGKNTSITNSKTMRSLRPTAYLGLALTFVFASCSVEKRAHLPGYHVEWYTSKKKVKKIEKKSDEQTAVVENTYGKAWPVEQPVKEVVIEPTLVAEQSTPIETKTANVEAPKQIEHSSKASTGSLNRVIATEDIAGGSVASRAISSTIQKLMPPPSGSPTAKKWLRLWLICWGIALLVTILSAIMIASLATGVSLGVWGVLAILGWLAWLAGTVFGILWLIEILN